MRSVFFNCSPSLSTGAGSRLEAGTSGQKNVEFENETIRWSTKDYPKQGLFIARTADLKTRRERFKSALYLRLKKLKKILKYARDVMKISQKIPKHRNSAFRRLEVSYFLSEVGYFVREDMGALVFELSSAPW